MITPWGHQKIGTQFLLDNPRAGLFSDPGTGKTKMVIDAVMPHKERLPMLILCPKSGISVWQEQFVREGYNPAVEVVETARKKLFALSLDSNVYLTNHETLRTSGNYIAVLLLDKLKTLIIDESTYYKNGKAQITKQAIRLFPNIFYKVIMTGTPVGEGYQDIFYQFLIMDNGATFGTDYYEFLEEYFVQNEDYRWRLKPPQKETLQQLKDKIYKKCIFFPASVLKDIPSVRQQLILLKMTSKQEDAYKKMDENFELEYKEFRYDTKWIVSKIEKLLQIASGYISDENKKIKQLGTLKEEWLVNFFSNIRKRKKRIIIWVKHHYVISRIEEILKEFKMKYAIFTGECSSQKRKEILANFKANEYDAVIGQFEAGKFSISFSNADYMIYYENPWSYIVRYQSEKRVIRPGGGHRESIMIYDLVTEGTKEVDQLNARKERKSLLQYIRSKV